METESKYGIIRQTKSQFPVRELLRVPHKGKTLTVGYPAFGPHYYINVGKEILNRGQSVPTGDLIAPLVRAVYCDENIKNEPESKDVREIMRDGWLHVFNRDIWASNGLYVIKDEDALGREALFNLEELEDLLSGGDTELGVRFSQDRKIRFAPKSTYILGEHTPGTNGTLARDGSVIANYDVKGAEQLGEASSEFRYNPRSLGLDIQEGQAPEQRIAGLGSGRVLDGYGLGYAFGVVSNKS